MKTAVRKTVLALAIPAAVVIFWIYAKAAMDIPDGILPTIKAVGQAFAEMASSGQLWEDLGVSLGRVVKGFLVSAVLGVIFGSLIGMFRTVRELFKPMFTVIRQIPMIAWIPLIILWFGIGELSKVVIIVLAAFFQVMVNTESGIEQTPEDYLEVAKLYRLNPWKTFTKVYLPHALPQILVGLKLALSVSWMAVVAAELIAATSGIGYRMSNARSLMQSDVVIVCMIVVGIIGIIMDKGIGLIFESFTPWKRLDKKKK